MSGVARTITLAAVVATLATYAAPPPASAFSPANAICSLTGLVSTLAGKACSVAAHPGRVISAGKKLLGGHLGGAIDTITSSGATKAIAARVGLAAIVTVVAAGASFALRETAKVIGATTRPNLRSTWFSASYWRLAGVSALLTLPFLFAAAIQALLRSDLPLLVRAAFGYLPLGLLAVGVAAPLTMLLLAGSDELSAIVSAASGHAGTRFLSSASVKLGAVTLVSGTPFLAFFVGLLTAAATLVLWIELLVRDAAVYVIVLLLPLFFAALVWPARRIWATRAVELLVALILSKFAIVAVLALGGAALGHTAIPGPAAFLSGVTLVLLASFSPWALLRLLPLHELASAAAGGLHAAPRQELVLGTQRAEAVSDRAEQVAGDLSARMRNWTAADPAGGADAGAVNPGDGPGAGEPPPDRAPAPDGASAPAGTPVAAETTPESAPADRALGGEDQVPAASTSDERPEIPALWPVRDGQWRTMTLDREITAPGPLVEPEAQPSPADRPPAEDHAPRPPAQDPDQGRL